MITIWMNLDCLITGVASAGLLESQGEVNVGVSLQPSMRTLEDATSQRARFSEETYPIIDAETSSGSDGATLGA